VIGTKIVNRYEIVAELGRGGMGVVYRARDPLLGRDVAVKLVPPTLLTPQSEERFQREAQVVAQMDHPAIVSIYDIGRHEGSLFFLMPVVRGENLRSFLKSPRSLGEIIEIIVQVAEALDYSHSRGVVHRDIKPENIMVAEEDSGVRVRVMDFGLAKATSEDRLTKTGTLLGTVSYFSPEQLTTSRVDGRTDIYALAVVLYEALSGQPPFAGEIQSVLYRIAHENPRPLRSLGIDVPEDLDDILLQALQKEPSRRQQSAGEFAEALRKCRAKLADTEKDRSMVLSTMITGQLQRPAATPFVGRERESAELQRRLHAAIDGECQFVVIGGAPGIGKTRLAEEIEGLAKARKIRVYHGRFVEQERTFSYQGFCEVIQEHFRAREISHSSGDHPDFSDLAPDLVSLFPVLSEIGELRSSSGSDPRMSVEPRKGEDRTYVYELLARTLTRIAGGRPLVLVLENLHGAEMSLEALAYVVRRLGPTPTLIVGTYRQTEIEKRHPLTRMLDSFGDDPRFTSMVLGPLSSSEHRRFVESIVRSSELVAGFAERLFEATEANPFFTKELVRSLIDSGGITKDESGAWTLSGEVGISSEALPATIQQAVEKRIERLPDEVRDLLSVASVLGKSFESRDLEMLAESRGAVDEIIERLIGDGLFEEERDSRSDRLTFSSGIVRDVLYSAISRRKRKSLHRRYAEHLEKRYEGRLDRIYPQLVHHFSEGDVPEKTVEYGLQLAKNSLAAFSAEETIHVARTVLDFLEDEDWIGDRATAGEARVLLASAFRMAGNLDAALKESEAAIRIFEKEKHIHRALATALLAAETAWQGRRVEETSRWLLHGLESARSASENEILSKFLSLAATVANLRGEYGKAKEYLDEAERLGAGLEEHGEEDVPRGGTLVVALANPVSAGEPAEMGIDEEVEVLSLVFETLVSTDEKGHLVPQLCESWELRDEGRSLVISLRGDVRFHDGSLLTARDVKTSFERAITVRKREMSAAFAAIEGVAEFREGQRPDVSGIAVHTERQVEIRLIKPLPIYPALLTDTTTAITRTSADSHIIGSGPFRIAKRDGSTLLLEANASYWKGVVPPLAAIEFRVMPNASSIATSLRAGEVDLARDLRPEDLDEVLREPRFRGGLVEAPKKNSYFVVFNCSSPSLQNVEVRRALCGTFRTHEIVWQTLGRLAQPATGLIPPGIFGHDPGRRRTPLSRDQAIGMLSSAGVELPLRLTAAMHPLFQDRYRALTDALLSTWAELGVEVSIGTPDMESFLGSFHDNDRFDMIIGRWNADYDDPDNFANGLFRSADGAYSQYFSSPEMDRLILEAQTETHPSVRENLYRKFENLLHESGALLPLFHEIDYRVADPKVRGLHLRGSPPYVAYAEIGKAETGAKVTATARVGRGILHIPVAEDIGFLDPALGSTLDRLEVCSTIFETLTRSTESAHITPWLASSFQVEDGGRAFRFHLREDVRFHDGRRLTARDVRYSWERLLSTHDDPRWLLAPVRGAEAVISGKARDLEGFRIISSREFVVELEKPLAFFPALVSHAVTAIVPEGTTAIGGSWKDGCAGTGPFRLVRFEPGKLVNLERNPHYWRPGFPRTEGLVFHLGVSAEKIRDEFRAGRFSLASDLFPADVETLRHNPEFASNYREIPRMSVWFAAFNTHRPPLSDPELRRRLCAHLDVSGIVRRTLGRLAIPANGLIPPGLLGHDATPRTRAVPASAQADVEIELNAAVHPLMFGQYAHVANELKAALREHGIRIRVMNKTMPEYLQLTSQATDIDMTVGRWIGDYPDSDTFTYGVLHSQGGTVGRLCSSPETDSLVEQGRAEIDPAARDVIYRKIEEIVARDAMLLPLFYEQSYRFARPEVENLTMNFSHPEVSYENLSIRA